MTISLDKYQRGPNITGNGAFTQSVTPTGTPIGALALVYVYGTSAHGPLRVTYGSRTMRQLSWGNDYSSELTVQHWFFMDRDVPSGTQNFTTYLEYAGLDKRAGQTWVPAIWLFDGDGDGIRVTSLKRKVGAGGTLGANPQWTVDTTDVSLIVQALVSGHDAVGSHAHVSGFTNNAAEDWGSGTGRSGYETTPKSGSRTAGFTAADEDGVAYAIAVTDGGFDRSLPAVVRGHGPIGTSTEADKTLITIGALNRTPRVLAAVGINMTNNATVMSQLQYGGVNCTLAGQLDYDSNRFYLYYMLEPPNGASLVAKHSAQGASSRWMHWYIYLLDGDGDVSFEQYQQRGGSSIQTYFTSLGSASIPTVGIGGGRYDNENYWGNPTSYGDDTKLGHAVTTYNLGYDWTSNRKMSSWYASNTGPMTLGITDGANAQAGLMAMAFGFTGPAVANNSQSVILV